MGVLVPYQEQLQCIGALARRMQREDAEVRAAIDELRIQIRVDTVDAFQVSGCACPSAWTHVYRPRARNLGSQI